MLNVKLHLVTTTLCKFFLCEIILLILYFIMSYNVINNRLDLDKQLESGRRPTSFLHMIQKCLGRGQRLTRSIWNGERHSWCGWLSLASSLEKSVEDSAIRNSISNDIIRRYNKIFRIAILFNHFSTRFLLYLYLLPCGRLRADKCNNYELPLFKPSFK